MHLTQSQTNTHFAHVLFSTLKILGIDHVFMAPGSRSCPLSLAAHHYGSKFITGFDERSLSFLALGKIRGDQKPAIIITTSGSAVGNLLPALMEAYSENLPLLLITADRPHELHDKGSNQTVKQAGIFEPFTAYSTSFDAPSEHFNERAFTSLLSFCAGKLKTGPVHLNIPLYEPLFDPACDFPHDVEFRKEYTSIDDLNLSNKKGLIILGQDSEIDSYKSAFFNTLSNHLDAPILADITSGYRSFGYESLMYYPLILESFDLDIDYILHFGKKFISKTLENFIKKFTGCYYHFDETTALYDPFHKITCTFRASFEKWKLLLNQQAAKTDFKDNTYRFNKIIKQKIKQIINDYPSYEEAMYIEHLNEYDFDNSQIFCGNSLPIRHLDSFFFPHQCHSNLFFQRGLSGIDGLISTACGLSLNGKTTYAFLGDLSTLHDINALSIISEKSLPVIPIIFNNHGGGIFNYLPIATQTVHFDKIMSTSHSFNFKDIAHGFDLDHVHISSLDEFQSFMKNPSLYTVVEIVSDKAGNPKFLNEVKESVCSLVKSMKEVPILQSLSTDF